MKAIVYETYGPPEGMKAQEIEIPTAKEHEVLVKVHAVSLNLSDWEILTGTPLYSRIWGIFRPRFPILGSDLAGTVVAVGAKVSRLKPGQRVYGDTMGSFGGFAEFACVREELLLEIPESLSFEEASQLPQAGIIAYQGLDRGRRIKPGMKVLINGAGGGSGLFAIQMAKLWGAHVTAVDSALKQNHMRALGADCVLDYEKVDYAATGETYDWIVDLVGTRSVFAHARALAVGGCYQMVGGTMVSLLSTLVLGPLVGLWQKKRVGIFGAHADHQDFAAISDLVEEGSVKLVVDRRFSLEEAAWAVRYVGEGRALGKVVVII